MSGRHKVAVLVAEFVGTYVLATAMVAMLVRTNFEFFSALAGAAVYGGLYLVFGGVSGSHLNPAVTISQWTMRKISFVHGLIYIVVQVLAGWVAWQTAQYFLNQKLTKTATGGFTSGVWRVFLAEAVGAILFGMVIAVVSVKKDLENSKKAAILAAGLFGGILLASLASNGLLNPSVAIASNSVSWAYISAPIVGVLIGSWLYVLLFTESQTKVSASASKATTTKAVSSRTKTASKPKPKAKK